LRTHSVSKVKKENFKARHENKMIAGMGGGVEAKRVLLKIFPPMPAGLNLKNSNFRNFRVYFSTVLCLGKPRYDSISCHKNENLITSVRVWGEFGVMVYYGAWS
jgi:hypothetical protein